MSGARSIQKKCSSRSFGKRGSTIITLSSIFSLNACSVRFALETKHSLGIGNDVLHVQPASPTAFDEMRPRRRRQEGKLRKLINGSDR